MYGCRQHLKKLGSMSSIVFVTEGLMYCIDPLFIELWAFQIFNFLVHSVIIFLNKFKKKACLVLALQ